MQCIASPTEPAIYRKVDNAVAEDAARRLQTARVNYRIAEDAAGKCKPGSPWHTKHTAATTAARNIIATETLILASLHHEPQAQTLRARVTESPLCNFNVRHAASLRSVLNMRVVNDVRIAFFHAVLAGQAKCTLSTAWNGSIDGHNYRVEVL